MTECIHLLDPGVCALCNDSHTPVRHLIREEPEGLVTARYPGTCHRCDTDINEGDALGLYRGEWIHLIHFDDGGVE